MSGVIDYLPWVVGVQFLQQPTDVLKILKMTVVKVFSSSVKVNECLLYCV